MTNKEVMEKRKQGREYRSRNRLRLAKADKRWRESNREHVRKYKKVSRSTPTGKAQHILEDAVRRGRIIKPNVCQSCGLSFQKSAVHGHHPDYDKPLEVVLVCMCCHAAIHRALRGEILPAKEQQASEGKCLARAELISAGISPVFRACVLPKGHDGEHQGGGNCFKHGEYVGAQCPKWPDCVMQPAEPEEKP